MNILKIFLVTIIFLIVNLPVLTYTEESPSKIIEVVIVKVYDENQKMNIEDTIKYSGLHIKIKIKTVKPEEELNPNNQKKNDLKVKRDHKDKSI